MINHSGVPESRIFPSKLSLKGSFPENCELNNIDSEIRELFKKRYQSVYYLLPFKVSIGHQEFWSKIQRNSYAKADDFCYCFTLKICKYLISLKKFYYRKKSWWFYVPLSVLFSSYGGSASIYHLSVIKSYVDSNPDPSGLLTKEQRKNLIVVVSQTLVSKYLLMYFVLLHWTFLPTLLLK